MNAPGERLEFLRRSQNPDGGWGYFPGKRSWMEPTVYAAIALQDDAAADRAFRLVQSWALRDGGWRASADVAEPNWTSALAIHLYATRSSADQAYRRGVHYLLRTLGIESNALTRTAQSVRGSPDLDVSLTGWPWLAGCASWVEPTVHAILALKRIMPELSPREAEIAGKRLRLAEAMLVDRQCQDGGWNYGNRRVLGETLPSYPETTAVAIIGLRGLDWPRRGDALRRTNEYAAQANAPLAASWLRLASKVAGIQADHTSTLAPRNDVVVNALLACAEHPSAWGFFRA